MRVVVDSNVWISALVFGGNPRRIFEYAVRQGLTVVVSAELFTEVRRTLIRKFPDFLADFEDLVVILERCLYMVSLGAVKIELERDPTDAMVLETAVAGEAEVIVSGDEDLLNLKIFRTIQIVSPAEFLHSYIRDNIK